MKKKVYVLGAYGLIGSACVRHLLHAGFDVTGVGRSLGKGLQSNNRINWCIADIARASVSDWSEMLKEADIVVNAAGALQDGGRDNLEAIHVTLIENITRALEGRDVQFIQISAAGATEQASTSFMQSKARGDRILINSHLNWQIFRPSLVISRDAYGGTALLRAAAAFPLINFQIFPDTPIQTVSIDDVTYAVVKAANGVIPAGTIADLTEEDSHRFDELKAAFRQWLGLPAWTINVKIPDAITRLLGKCADLAGLLGWRAPLRTNALKSLQDGIIADADSWQKTGNPPCRSLEDTLSAMPATVQERWFARLYMMLPLAIGILSLFWIASGAIGLYALNDAGHILVDRGMSSEAGTFLVIIGAVADIALGTAVLARRFSKYACLGMIAVSAGYLISSLATAPDLWLDPLGPLVKVVPSIILTLFTLSILDDR
ncbi:SDR family oxidoreductase [Thalassospira sp. TSL5-1]|uniref:SDR family oxidoreductase n=1 Tax=Thalassospira sp. TSL5-1 TaxID=1544451 RepID=UPI00093CE5BE|nr:SDR family oxidoreductase [Thalassospira sp. TSL5-1]OKH87732.1 hypothetical protein LF95_13390 [Thalassospira sp. TSL5-1]